MASFAGMSVDKGGKGDKSNANAQLPSKHNKVTGCAQCYRIGPALNEVLVWETMRFCTEICLGEYQVFGRAHCSLLNIGYMMKYFPLLCFKWHTYLSTIVNFVQA